jgi:hypothetical protein
MTDDHDPDVIIRRVLARTPSRLNHKQYRSLTCGLHLLDRQDLLVMVLCAKRCTDGPLVAK